jgi:hypothetical protein
MDLPPDPRLKIPSYSRDETIAAVMDYYQFLTKMPFLEPSDILYPPPEGWPQITKERLAKKSDEVIELLRHLPYVDSRREVWQIMPDSRPCDYVNKHPKDYKPYTPGDFEFPPWVINLTFGGRYGKSLMFDTTDGMALECYLPLIFSISL